MATTFNDNGGNTPNGSHLNFTYTFPVIKNADVKVALNGITQASTKYTVNSGVNPTRIEFNNTSIDSTLQESTGAPKTGVVVRVYRDTGLEDPADRRVTFQAGSAIRAQDLNNMYEHLIFSTQEEQNQLERITDADVIPTAEIQVSKLKDGAARQVLQTDAAGTGVEWTNNVDIPGTLDVTSTAAFDSNVSIAGTTTAAAINASGAVGVDGNFDVNTNKFTVAASSGNTVIGGDLDVQGNFEVTGTSLHTGQQTVPGGAQVKNIKVGLDAPNEVSTTSGNLILDSASGTVQTTDHFNVTGNADVDSNLNVDGTLTVDGTSTLTGNTSIGGTLTVTGTTNLASSSIGRAEIANDAIDGTKIDDDAINSEHYVDGSIDHVHLSNDSVDEDNIQDNAVRSEHILADAVTIDKIADAVIVTNSEQASHTANDTTFFTTSAADARYFNISTGDTIKDGDAFPDNDTTIATTAAINDRIIDLVDDVGGFVPIANETSFPSANPDVNNGTGTLVSVKSFASTHTPSGGTVTIANGAGSGNTVTITGCGSTQLPAGFGGIVETTTTLHTYTFHRLTPKATEVTTVAGKATEIGRLGTAAAVEDLGILGTTAVVEDLAILGTNDVVSDLNTLATNAIVSNLDTCATNVGNINTVGGAITNVNNVGGSISNVNTVSSNLTNVNNFADLYQIASSNPSTDGGGNSLAAGDLYFNTSADELKVWNGSSWQGGVTASGNFAAVTGNTFTGDNKYNDGVKILTGTGSDLEIFHASDVNNIKSVNGKIVVQTTAGNADIEVTPHGSGKVKLDGLSWPTADGSANQVLQTNGSGALSFATIAVGGATGTDYNDNVKVRWGTGNDLEIFHDGSNTKIDNATGELQIFSDTFRVISKSTDENVIKGLVNGAVELYFDNSKKLETTSTGVNITGVTVDDGATHDGDTSFNGASTNAWWDKSDSAFKFDDSTKAKFGTGGDLEISHDGNNSVIRNVGTGDLFVESISGAKDTFIRGSRSVFIQSNSNENHAKFIQNGATELYFDTSKKFQTTSAGCGVTGDLTFADNGKAIFGGGDDLQLFHDGNNSFIKDAGSGSLRILSNDARIINAANSEDMARFIENGAAELYHDGNKKFETTTNGASVTGKLDLSDNLDMPDNAKIIMGNSDDLKIFHNGTDSVFQAHVTGNIEMRARGNWIAKVNSTDGGAEDAIKAVQNGAVELYHNNSKKIETTSSGVLVSGNVDAGTGNFLTDDNGKYFAGTGGDLSIYHNGSDSFIDNATGAVLIRNLSGDDLVLQTVSAENNIKCKPNSQVELYFDNSEKIRTTSTGFKTLGNAQFDDSRKVVFGDGTDLEIFHDGTDSIIRNLTGQTRIQAANIFRVTNYGASETYIKGSLNGSTELYYDDVKHIETTSIGAKISDNDSTTALQFNTSSGDNGYVFADGTDTIGFKDNNPHWMVECTKGGRVLLLHNGNGKLETASWGVGITGNCSPTASNTHDLGSSSARWNNLYVNDMHFSNHPDNPNSVDGTWGDWTLQEGEEDIFMINNRSGKKYKMALTEVS